jgi:signal transduction histidine kinase
VIPARFKPRIRTILLLVNLALLALPLGGLWLLRLYESALVRQTETELLAQGAVIEAAFRAEFLAASGRAEPPASGIAPRFAALDLAHDPVLPAPPPAAPGPAPDPHAQAAGARLTPILAQAQRATLAAMRVTDAQGVVVASSGGDLGLSLAAQEEVVLALSGQWAARLRARRDVVPAGPASISRAAAFRVFVAVPVPGMGAVLLSRTPASIDQALWGKRRELAVLAVVLLGLAAGLAMVTAYTVSRPISTVAAQAKLVAAGGRMPPVRARLSAVREADELFAAIRDMAGTLQRRADYIEQFATEVSHEFKTPLAALSGALELLEDHIATMSAGERHRFIAQAREDAARLERLVRRLIDLARAEAPREAAAPTALHTVLRDATRGLDATLDGPDTDVLIAPDALRSILQILLENIAQHAGAGARITLRWQRDSAEVLLRVADDGPGISPANAARIFDRFFTTARATGGSGLGLAIARGHAEAAGGALWLDHPGPGAVLALRLRAA